MAKKAWQQEHNMANHTEPTARKQKMNPGQLATSFFSFIQSETQPMWWNYPHSGPLLPPQLNLSGKSLTDAQRHISYVILNAVGLTVTINHHLPNIPQLSSSAHLMCMSTLKHSKTGPLQVFHLAGDVAQKEGAYLACTRPWVQFSALQKKGLGLEAHVCNPSTWEMEEGRWEVQDDH